MSPTTIGVDGTMRLTADRKKAMEMLADLCELFFHRRVHAVYLNADHDDSTRPYGLKIIFDKER